MFEASVHEIRLVNRSTSEEILNAVHDAGDVRIDRLNYESQLQTNLQFPVVPQQWACSKQILS